MSQVKLTKVQPAEMKVLQHEVMNYVVSAYKTKNDSYYSFMLVQDIGSKLFKFLRNKIENNRTCSFSLNVTDAVIILLSCIRDEKRLPFNTMVTEKYKNIIDKQLKSFHIIVDDNNLEIQQADETL